jgi:rfaE bifunctional protein kinase chain/domain
MMVELNLTEEQVAAYTKRFSSTRIWVLGDVMLDRYFWGTVSRISPEAPVPVVQVSRKTSRLGGAANVAANLRALGVEVTLLGVTGADQPGDELRTMLSEREIDHEGLVSDRSRATTEKVRIIAQSQQIVRADFESCDAVSDETAEGFRKALRRGARVGDALVVSDYGKGVVQEDCLTEAIAIWREQGKPVLVDPHIEHFHWYKRASLITPNSKEASSFFGASLNGEQSLETTGFGIKKALDLDALLITRGEEGMSLFRGEHDHLHVPTVAKEVYDVTGAGDTVISVMAAGLGAGIDILDTVILSNQAAGAAVKEIGTATVTGEALINAFK